MEKLTSKQIGEKLEQIDLELDGDKWIAFQVLITERLKEHDPDNQKTILEIVSSMPEWKAHQLLNEVNAILNLT